MELGNTVTNSRIRKVCFTLNNYTQGEYDDITQITQAKCKYWIIAKEIGESGTPHLQGYIEFKDAKTFSSIKAWNTRLHLEKAKGSRQQNFNYCSKDGDFITNDSYYKMMNDYNDVEWRPWQLDIINKIEGPVNKRKIYFIVDVDGNKGKSFLTKYLFLKYRDEILITNGKAGDSFNQVLTHLTQDLSIKVLIVDIPRSVLNFVSYQAIEKIKDGLFYSGKYEGGICCFETPHIFIFMNQQPNLDAMSNDRYDIIEV